MDYVDAVCEEYHEEDAGEKLFHYSDDRKFFTRWRSVQTHWPIAFRVHSNRSILDLGHENDVRMMMS